MSVQVLGTTAAGPSRGRDTGRGLSALMALNSSTAVQWITNCCEVDVVSLQLVWDAALTATVVLYGSNDYMPSIATPQTETTTLRGSGPNWDDITSEFTKKGTSPAGGAERHCSYLYPRHFEYLFLRIVVTPNGSSAATNIASYESGKQIR